MAVTAVTDGLCDSETYSLKGSMDRMVYDYLFFECLQRIATQHLFWDGRCRCRLSLSIMAANHV